MEIAELQARMLQFRDERDRKQFHNPKDLAVAISIEAWELLEPFLRKTTEKAYEIAKKEEIADELADIFSFMLIFAHESNINLEDAFLRKIQKSGEKYPIEKAKGKSDKYNVL